MTSRDVNPEVPAAVDKIMAHVGLTEMCDPVIGRSPPVLKGVFERLYQDAVQRVQRYGLIRERMLAANAACSQIVAALGDQHPKDDAEAVPDFERLNATAQAALRGMWYQTDYLFRATCAYAMSQGVENSLLKVHRDTLTDLIDTSEDTDLAFPLDEYPRKAYPRLKARREGRPNRIGGSNAVGSNREWSQGYQTGAGSLRSPQPTRKQHLQHVDPESTSFSQYVAALAESRSDFRDDRALEDWPKSRDKKKLLDPRYDTFDTLKEACEPRARGGIGKGLATSQSLPALPKGRNHFQGESPTSTLTSKLASSLDSARQM